MKKLFQTNDAWSYLILRVALGIVMFPHGAQKLLGWFGGHGFTNTLSYLTQKAGLPWVVAFLVIVGESLGALGLVAGLFTRLCALGMICIMMGAVLTVHLPNGFFMNWSGKQAGEGYEYHLLNLAIAITLLIFGGGKFSMDRLITKYIKKD